MTEVSSEFKLPKSDARLASGGLGAQRYLDLFERLTPLIGVRESAQVGRQACQLVAQILDVEACSILLYNDEEHCLSLNAATHIPEEEWPGVKMPVSEGVCGKVFQTGQPLLIRGRENFRRMFGREPNEKYQSPSCVVVPLTIRQEVAGVINIAQPNGRRVFAIRDIDLLMSTSCLIGGAIAGAREYEQMLNMRNQLRSIFNNLHVAVLSIDTEQRVVQFNERACLLFGEKHLNERDKPRLIDVLPGIIYNVCSRMLRHADRTMDTQQELVETEHDGQPLKLEITVNPAHSLTRFTSHNLLTFADVGQEEEMHRLRESEQMKHDFLAIISHELRTPLTVIKGAIPLLDTSKGKMVQPEMLTKIHDLLSRNCLRLNDVVSAIFDVTEIERGTLRLSKRQVDLNEVIDEAINAHTEEAARKKLTWDCRFDDQIPQLPADQRRLRQVLSEMIHNAVKFSPSDQTIRIRTNAAAGVYAEIAISNWGAPINPELRASIFEKFYQCNQSRTREVGGCGLGLFLARNIIRLHEGTLELAETAPEETTFVIRLPFKTESPTQKEA